MAEYIDRLQLVSDICRRTKEVEYADGNDEYPFAYGTLTGLRMAMNLVNKAPSADVVPKSEVEELIKSVDDMLDLVCAMTGLELTYFGKYAELKKKYTE